MNRRRALFAFAGITVAAPYTASVVDAQGTPNEANVRWVAEVLERMTRIRPGMTRAELLQVFRTEGGLWEGLQRTYVSKDCQLFKVDVTFLAVGRPPKDEDGRETIVEDGRDRILTISQPYVASGVFD